MLKFNDLFLPFDEQDDNPPQFAFVGLMKNQIFLQCELSLCYHNITSYEVKEDVAHSRDFVSMPIHM